MADISLVLTFHAEGLLAQRGLAGAARCLAEARARGLDAEVVAVLDRADGETRRIVQASPVPARTVPTELGDAGEARNAGIAAARGKWISVCDGDDYASANWLAESHACGEGGDRLVLHPEYLVNFGDEVGFCRLPDLAAEGVPQDALLTYNPWPSCVTARRDVFLSVPYVGTRTRETGFGYEDWHWACEAAARGYRHVTVPGTATFYRRISGGRMDRETGGRALMRPSSLFARPAS